MSGSTVHHDNHGKTTAAWTGVFICLLGSALMALGVGLSRNILLYIGTAIFLAGGIIGWAMGRAARGKATPHTPIDSQRKPA